MEFYLIDPVKGEASITADPYEANGGWLNLPMEDKGYEQIMEFAIVVGDFGRVLKKEDMSYAIEFFSGTTCLAVFFVPTYYHVVKWVKEMVCPLKEATRLKAS